MKLLWILIPALLAGCQTAPPSRTETPVVLPPLPPLPAPQPRESDLEARLQQQRYVIDALLSQQESWQAQANPARPTEPGKPMRFLPRKPEPAPAPSGPAGKYLQPNGAGVIDLAAIGKPATDESTNPFVAATAAAPSREIALALQGVMPGPNPSAIVNDRPLEIGEGVDSLRLARVDDDGVVFAAGEQQIRIPLGQTVRVRLP